MKNRFFAGLALVAIGTSAALALDLGEVKGRLVDEKGQPLVGATVTFEPENPKAKPWTMQTNKKGMFDNDRAVPGRYKATFTMEGFRTKVGPVDVVKNNPNDLGDVKMTVAPPTETPAFAAADALFKEGKYPEAAAAYKDLVAKSEGKIPPVDMAKLYFNYGLVYEMQKDWDNAEAQYKKALELDPTLMAAYGGLGNVYQALNKPDDAVKLFQAAAAAQPSNGRLQYDLGLFLWKKGKNEEAFDALKKAAALLPDNHEIDYHLGVTAIGLQKNDEAVQYLEKYLASNPTDAANVESAKTLIPAIKSTASTQQKKK
jgi:thioredoxin-like negative regulator of GroEL